MFILPKISVKYILRLKSIIKEVGANLFKKEDQKYNLISYINEDDDLTLREVLLDRLNFSVRYASKLKRFKTVTVNKNFKKLDKKVKKGDLIEVEIKEDMANFTPQDLNLNIIYDDFDLIMVDKPPFMVVHPTKSHFENTMANGVTDYIVKKGEDVKIRFVNRLDMNTSGLVIVAKNPFAQHVLSSEMKDDDFEKKSKSAKEEFIKFAQTTWIEEITNDNLGSLLQNEWTKTLKMDAIFKQVKNKYDLLYKNLNIEKTASTNKIIVAILAILLIMNIISIFKIF